MIIFYFKLHSLINICFIDKANFNFNIIPNDLCFPGSEVNQLLEIVFFQKRLSEGHVFCLGVFLRFSFPLKVILLDISPSNFGNVK